MRSTVSEHKDDEAMVITFRLYHTEMMELPQRLIGQLSMDLPVSTKLHILAEIFGYCKLVNDMKPRREET